MTDDARTTALRRRYLSLGLGEFAAAGAFTGIAVLLLIPRLTDEGDVAALWFALAPLLLILAQAGSYWLLARSWVGRSPMPRALARIFLVIRAIDVAVLGLGLLGLIIWWPRSTGVAIGLLAVWLFGVVEYVNYFVVRLAYPPGRWLTSVGQRRVPRLLQDARGGVG